MNSPHSPIAYNARPEPASECPSCKKVGVLGHLLQGVGNGSIVTNWGRWFQRVCSILSLLVHPLNSCFQCNGCSHFHWHNDPTPIEAIPEDVLLRYTLRQSSEALLSGSLCPEANCLTANNQARRANKECERTPPRCAQCCKGLGGCSVKSHKLSVRDVPPDAIAVSTNPSLTTPPGSLATSAVPPTAGTSVTVPTAPSASTSHEPMSAVQRTFARPLKDHYAQGYVVQHQKREEATRKQEQALALAQEMSNVVEVTFWGKVPLFSLLHCAQADLTLPHSLERKPIFVLSLLIQEDLWPQIIRS